MTEKQRMEAARLLSLASLSNRQGSDRTGVVIVSAQWDSAVIRLLAELVGGE